MGRKERSGDQVKGRGSERGERQAKIEGGKRSLISKRWEMRGSEWRVLRAQSKAKESTARKHKKLLEYSSSPDATAHSSATFDLGGRVKTPLRVGEQKLVKIVFGKEKRKQSAPLVNNERLPALRRRRGADQSANDATELIRRWRRRGDRVGSVASEPGCDSRDTEKGWDQRDAQRGGER